MNDRILSRILRKAAVPDLLAALTDRLSLPDLQSLLLEVYRRRAAELPPGYLLQQYRQNRFVQPAQAPPQRLLELDRLAFSLLPPGFQVLELSPVCPLGTSSIVAAVDQNNAVTTIRNTEVCADSTNVLALECARRRRDLMLWEGPAVQDTKLCASHRLLRAQVFQGPDHFAHFRVLGLCTAGRDRGAYGFELEALGEQMGFYLRLLRELGEQGAALGGVTVRLTALDPDLAEALCVGVLAELSVAHPAVRFSIVPGEGAGGYYLGARFQIDAGDAAGKELNLVDGGFTGWTQQLLSDRKERLLVSGLGTERLALCFPVPA